MRRRRQADRDDHAFAGRTAVVTGGGSGIGAAFTRALASAGAHVWCADIDEQAATRTAQSTGSEHARAVGLDVTDADAVRSVVNSVVADHGRIDLMFNNAGIALGGNTEELTAEQWDAVIDVNIRGVVHGVTAAYPHMIRQGSGHIVNTASMAGLTAAGLLTSYVMSKHAIVGLSLALRTEAAAHGVGVLVVCPAAVETPMLDADGVGGFTGRTYYLSGQGIRTPYPADRLASDTLRAIGRNQPLLVVPAQARMAWRFARISPGLMQTMATRFVAGQRERQGL
ncbi:MULTISPECIES: SDR family oxidoreductase [unclassified Gordonia (in: high G+C Gram-positive bacteria)]|uniref:SDR family NAD(P)-dependent oxidoreductase n=1 Tax=unclassified Gordonia (in: high G+C Gram-positive bacteria) TaxID=2657482 RepID=UPI0009AE053B|nr:MULTISPECIES: SDR family oxidoreductase [unclassified Gordonia (in: high G+C Gram-positive bacteria)]MDF3282942.1 SDR family NAD(P)-dependent oxidoreductase [Gordonia sp. N1V]OPX10896.1 short-chain dehydrogenase [Gordonia sp. i37]